MRQIKPTVAILLSGLLLVASAQQPAQQANAPLPPPKTFKFEASAQLVVINVSAKDKNGKPIQDLRASDFTVTEDGKPQEIKVFEYQRLEEEAAPQLQPRPAAPAKQPDVNAIPTSTAPSVAAAVKSTISPAKPGEVRYRDRRLMVLYFDFQGMQTDDQIRAQEGAVKFIKTQMTPSDMVAVMSYTGELKVLLDFTNDRDALKKVIDGLVVGEASEMSNTVSDDSSSDTGAAYTADDSEFNIFNTDRQLSALEAAVKMLASLSEKKALVYFSGGVTRNGADNDAQLRSTINAAIRSNVSVYTVDSRGLVATAPMGNASSASTGGQAMFSGAATRAAASSLSGSQDTLFAIAADTGGKAFQDSNDLALGIVQAQKDIASYYILGYYSNDSKMDGKYRKIKVQINNNLTAKLDYRSGYFAGKEFKKFNASDRERQLEEALMLGDPVTDLAIALETDYFRLARDRYYVPVTIKIPGSDIVLAKRGGAETTRLDFIGQIRDSNGKLSATVRDYITVKLKSDSASQLAKKTIAYDAGFTLMPGKYTIKFLARDNETGKMGTFETSFLVPNLTADNKLLPISSVILSNQREKLEAAIGGAGPGRRLLNASPLVQGGEKLVPSVTRVFRKDQEMFVFLEAYEPTSETTQPLIATLSFYRGKVKAFESAPLQISDGLNPMTKAVALRFSVPLSKLEVGRYTCQVTVLNPSAQRFAFWRSPMTLLPPATAE
jgi:VWFA-related protein